jgi:hypothetical protein
MNPTASAPVIAPQSIAHRTRQLMCDPKWDWRNRQLSDEPVTIRATAILRRDYRLAQDWLLRTRPVTRLPLGNGTNDAWNIQAHLTPEGRLGIVDIATGTATTYSVTVPSAVARFATPTERSQSHHLAGGTGGTPCGWRQILVILSGQDSGSRIRVGHLMPESITWGLSTCYGRIGTAPENPPCPCHETTEPQREEIPFGRGVEPDFWNSFIRSHCSAYRSVKITTHPGNFRGLHYVYCLGIKAARQEVIPKIREDYRKFVMKSAVEDMLRTMERNSFRIFQGNTRADLHLLETITLAISSCLDTPPSGGS